MQQELWAVLVLYQVLRHTMADAVRTERGVDVDRASFTVALETARDQVVTATGVLAEQPCGQNEIAKAIRANLLPTRRARTSARRVKSPVSRYRACPSDRPPASTGVTAIDITILTATSIAERPGRGPVRNRAGEDQARIHRVYQLMTAEPHRAWGPAELAHVLDITNIQVQDCSEVGEGELVDQEADIVGVTAASGVDFHGEQVLRRGRGDAQPGVLEDLRGVGVAADGDVDAGLLVKPPIRQAELPGDGARFVEHDSVWFE
jgi:hypothetical protein